MKERKVFTYRDFKGVIKEEDNPTKPNDPRFPFFAVNTDFNNGIIETRPAFREISSIIKKRKKSFYTNSFYNNIEYMPYGEIPLADLNKQDGGTLGLRLFLGKNGEFHFQSFFINSSFQNKQTPELMIKKLPRYNYNDPLHPLGYFYNKIDGNLFVHDNCHFEFESSYLEAVNLPKKTIFDYNGDNIILVLDEMENTIFYNFEGELIYQEGIRHLNYKYDTRTKSFFIYGLTFKETKDRKEIFCLKPILEHRTKTTDFIFVFYPLTHQKKYAIIEYREESYITKYDTIELPRLIPSRVIIDGEKATSTGNIIATEINELSYGFRVEGVHFDFLRNAPKEKLEVFNKLFLNGDILQRLTDNQFGNFPTRTLTTYLKKKFEKEKCIAPEVSLGYQDNIGGDSFFTFKHHLDENTQMFFVKNSLYFNTFQKHIEGDSQIPNIYAINKNYTFPHKDKVYTDFKRLVSSPEEELVFSNPEIIFEVEKNPVIPKTPLQENTTTSFKKSAFHALNDFDFTTSFIFGGDNTLFTQTSNKQKIKYCVSNDYIGGSLLNSEYLFFPTSNEFIFTDIIVKTFDTTHNAKLIFSKKKVYFLSQRMTEKNEKVFFFQMYHLQGTTGGYGSIIKYNNEFIYLSPQGIKAIVFVYNQYGINIIEKARSETIQDFSFFPKITPIDKLKNIILSVDNNNELVVFYHVGFNPSQTEVFKTGTKKIILDDKMPENSQNYLFTFYPINDVHLMPYTEYNNKYYYDQNYGIDCFFAFTDYKSKNEVMYNAIFPENYYDHKFVSYYPSEETTYLDEEIIRASLNTKEFYKRVLFCKEKGFIMNYNDLPLQKNDIKHFRFKRTLLKDFFKITSNAFNNIFIYTMHLPDFPKFYDKIKTNIKNFDKKRAYNILCSIEYSTQVKDALRAVVKNKAMRGVLYVNDDFAYMMVDSCRNFVLSDTIFPQEEQEKINFIQQTPFYLALYKSSFLQNFFCKTWDFITDTNDFLNANLDNVFLQDDFIKNKLMTENYNDISDEILEEMVNKARQEDLLNNVNSIQNIDLYFEEPIKYFVCFRPTTFNQNQHLKTILKGSVDYQTNAGSIVLQPYLEDDILPKPKEVFIYNNEFFPLLNMNSHFPRINLVSSSFPMAINNFYSIGFTLSGSGKVKIHSLSFIYKNNKLKREV